MKTLFILFALAALSSALAEVTKPFPTHWGEPPKIQTHDYRELPAGYGHGSSTLANWIKTHLAEDAKAGAPTKQAPVKALYACDFNDMPEGPLPDSFMVIQGQFEVKDLGTNKVMELPGAPLDSYLILFGPVTNANVTVSASLFGTKKGRRMPTFGVGLGGVAGYKLQIAPAKDNAELLLDTQVVASVPFDWKTGTWTHCELQIRETGDGRWRVEARAWPAGEAKPKEWLITQEIKEPPISGQASVLGSPFSGTPIQYDDLRVEEMQ